MLTSLSEALRRFTQPAIEQAVGASEELRAGLDAIRPITERAIGTPTALATALAAITGVPAPREQFEAHAEALQAVRSLIPQFGE